MSSTMIAKHAYLGFALLAGSLLQTSAAAQAPPHWQAISEAGDTSKPEFVAMPPGWHITTKTASLLFDPRRILEDRFTLTTELFVFPETEQDGYGIFIGGRELQGDAAQYLALQLRRDGSAAVVQRNGANVKPLIAWKSIAAVGPHPGKDQQQRVTMSIEVDTAFVAFTANGAEVGRLPRSGLDLSGHFGFRVGSKANLHVVRLDSSEKLAPRRN